MIVTIDVTSGEGEESGSPKKSRLTQPKNLGCQHSPPPPYLHSLKNLNSHFSSSSSHKFTSLIVWLIQQFTESYCWLTYTKECPRWSSKSSGNTCIEVRIEVLKKKNINPYSYIPNIHTFRNGFTFFFILLTINVGLQ